MPQILPMDAPAGVIIPQTTPPSAKLQNVKLDLNPSSQLSTPPIPSPQAQKSTSETDGTKTITAETSPQDAVRIAQMLRREKQILKRDNEVKAREKALTERETKFQPWQKAAEMAAQNKLEALKEIGITYDDLTQQVLNGGTVPPEIIAAQKAAEIAKAEIAAFKKQNEEAQLAHQQKTYQETIRLIDAEAQALIDSSDKFPLVKNAKAYQDITKEFEQGFYRTGKIRPVEEIAEQIETEAEEGMAELLGVTREQIQQMLRREAPAQVATKTQVTTPDPTQKITTLTHKIAQNAPSAEALTDSERRQRAIDAFYGRLS